MKELHHEPDVIHNTDRHPGDRLNGDQGGVDGMGALEPRHRKRRNSQNKQYLPIHGLPLSVVRTYDSREKDRSGRFGFGWDMKLTKATLSENGTPGSGWNMLGPGGGRRGYRLVGEKPHEVVVHWGNGKTDKFALTFDPAWSFYPIRWVKARYTSTDGGRSRLEALTGSEYLRYERGAVLDFDLDFRPYNPKRYRLTAVDGTVYVLNDQTGLESVRDGRGYRDWPAAPPTAWPGWRRRLFSARAAVSTSETLSATRRRLVTISSRSSS